MTDIRSRAARLARTCCGMLVLLIAPLSRMAGQAPPDSVAAWTRTLGSGSLQERENALAELTRGPVRTPAAALALVPAVAVSGGVERRVARLGDAAVDAVMPLLARGYEVPSMLETLGLTWF